MKVDLTKEQIVAIIYIAENTSTDPASLAGLFLDNLKGINTYIRGLNKLKEAIKKPVDSEWTKDDLNQAYQC